MPRSKVKLAFIENYKARKSSFMKRKESLKRKLEELSILCGVEACGILYSPFDPQPEVWPDNHNVVGNVLSAFLNMPPIERSKNMVSQESYIKDRISKVKEQIKKQVVVNREIEMENMMSKCLGGEVLMGSLNLTDLNDLVLLAGNKLSEIEERIEVLKSEVPAAVPPPELPPSNTVSDMVVEGGEADVYVPMMESNGELDHEMESTSWYPPDWICDDLVI